MRQDNRNLTLNLASQIMAVHQGEVNFKGKEGPGVLQSVEMPAPFLARGRFVAKYCSHLIIFPCRPSGQFLLTSRLFSCNRQKFAFGKIIRDFSGLKSGRMPLQLAAGGRVDKIRASLKSTIPLSLLRGASIHICNIITIFCFFTNKPKE